VGNALAIQICIGFAITVVFIAAALFEHVGLDLSWLLILGPVLGLLFFSWMAYGKERRLG